MRRPRAGRCLVALAVASGLVLGADTAVAGWQASNTGTSTAKAGTLAAPAGPTAAASTCSGTTGSQRFMWTAPAGAVSYQVEVASNATFTTGLQSATTTNTAATASQANASTRRTLYFRVRAVAGNWVSDNSAVVTGSIGPCP